MATFPQLFQKVFLDIRELNSAIKRLIHNRRSLGSQLVHIGAYGSRIRRLSPCRSGFPRLRRIFHERQVTVRKRVISYALQLSDDPRYPAFLLLSATGFKKFPSPVPHSSRLFNTRELYYRKNDSASILAHSSLRTSWPSQGSQHFHSCRNYQVPLDTALLSH